jgi:hypothetical protein
MPIHTRKYEVVPLGPNVVIRDVPGYDGQVVTFLNKRPKTVIETGWVSTDSATLALLHNGEGNPSTTQSINTLGKGTYTCWLFSVRLTGRSRGDGTKAISIEYERVWRPLVVHPDLS